jgi:two-component system, chemotaxis family, chemotaxis protein CheY
MPYNILIVDDSQTMRRVLRKTVTLSGVEIGECWEAGDGREALQILQSHSIDLILSDINMPGLSGLEMIQEMKREEKWRRIPVILITSLADEERLQEASTLGVEWYLQKPFHPEALRDLLTQMERQTYA